jgi:hypothetical protein
MLSVTVWSAAQTVAVVTPAEGTRALLERVKWTGIVTVPVTFLLFAARYAGRDRWVTPQRVGAMAAVSGALAVGVWLNPGQLMWADPQFTVEQGVAVMVYDSGPLYWVAVTYAYTLGVPATAMLAGLALEGDNLYLGQAVSLLVGTLAPLVLGAASAVGVTPMEIDLTPVGFAVTGVALAYALVRHDSSRSCPRRDGSAVTPSSGTCVTESSSSTSATA